MHGGTTCIGVCAGFSKYFWVMRCGAGWCKELCHMVCLCDVCGQLTQRLCGDSTTSDTIHGVLSCLWNIDLVIAIIIIIKTKIPGPTPKTVFDPGAICVRPAS